MKYFSKIINSQNIKQFKCLVFSFVGIILLLSLYLPKPAFAHNYSASFTSLNLNKDTTKMTFSVDTLSVLELVTGVDKNKDFILSKKELKQSNHKIEEVILESLALDKNNKEQTPELKRIKIEKKQNKEFLSFYVTFPAFAPGDTISLNDGLYAGNSGTTNYVNLLSVKYNGGTGQAALQGSDRTWTMLLTEDQQEQTSDQQGSQPDTQQQEQNQTHSATSVDKPSTSSWLSFFKLGMFHILTGYDHLLFLFALLIGRQTLKQYLGTITAFTIAHSITLTLAVLGVVDLPSKFVEAIIALSICYVAVENIFKKNINKRWVITFLFGLIHGLGFASILKDMNLAKSDLAVALINFNLGIEFIQLIIVLLLVPVLIKVQKSVKYPNYLKYGSIAIFILGFIWLIQRLFV